MEQRPETQFTFKTAKTGVSKSPRASRKGTSCKTRDQLPSVAESLNSEERQQLERQQSAAANRIMQEANKAGISDTFDDWQTKADEMVSATKRRVQCSCRNRCFKLIIEIYFPLLV